MLWFVEKRVPERGLWERKGSEKDRYGIVIISTKRWPSEFLTYMLIITLMYSCLWFERCSVEKDEKRRGFFKKKELHHTYFALKQRGLIVSQESYESLPLSVSIHDSPIKILRSSTFYYYQSLKKMRTIIFPLLIILFLRYISNHSLKIRRLKIDRSGNKISSTRLITRFPFICLSPPTERVLEFKRKKKQQHVQPFNISKLHK